MATIIGGAASGVVAFRSIVIGSLATGTVLASTPTLYRIETTDETRVYRPVRGGTGFT